MTTSLKYIAGQLFQKSLKAVLPDVLVNNSIIRYNDVMVVNGSKYKLAKNLFVVGFGKAVPGMAIGIHEKLSDHLVKGIISVPLGSKSKLSYLSPKFEILEGAKNNLPDASACENALEIKKLVESLSNDDNLLVLISGGGSALLPLPISEITLDEKLTTIKTIASNGGTIKELNTIRKNLSQLKGGKLLKMCPTKNVVSLIISDIVGNPIDLIASAPTVYNTSTTDDCLRIIEKLKVIPQIPQSVMNYLTTASNKTMEKNDSVSDNHSRKACNNFIIGSNALLTSKTCENSKFHGFKPYILTNELEGEAREIGSHFANLAISLLLKQSSDEIINITNKIVPHKEAKKNIEYSNFESSIKKILNNRDKVCIIGSGETTVNIKGSGRGGRNQEMALSFLSTLLDLYQKHPNLDYSKFCFLSAGTDGQDGPTEANGAFIDGALLNYMLNSKLDCNQFLNNNGSNDFFVQNPFLTDYLSITGFTGTNVMDVQFLLIDSS